MLLHMYFNTFVSSFQKPKYYIILFLMRNLLLIGCFIVKTKRKVEMKKKTYCYILSLTTNYNVMKLIHFVINICCINNVDHN